MQIKRSLEKILKRKQENHASILADVSDNPGSNYHKYQEGGCTQGWEGVGKERGKMEVL